MIRFTVKLKPRLEKRVRSFRLRSEHSDISIDNFLAMSESTDSSGSLTAAEEGYGNDSDAPTYEAVRSTSMSGANDEGAEETSDSDPPMISEVMLQSTESTLPSVTPPHRYGSPTNTLPCPIKELVVVLLLPLGIIYLITAVIIYLITTVIWMVVSPAKAYFTGSVFKVREVLYGEYIMEGVRLSGVVV